VRANFYQASTLHGCAACVTRRVFKGYVNAKVERIDLSPQSLNVRYIRHIGYCRANVGEKLWPQVLT
jgi:predicted alpha/beta hydrolase